MVKALILVDFENEWIDENSDYYIGDISNVIKTTNELINFCRDKGYKIIFIRHVEKDSENEFAEGSKNTQIIKDIDYKDSDVVITKYKINSFYNTTLEKELKDIKDIVVSGILTNLCVRMLVEEAYDREFNITVVKDCCVSIDEETHNFTLNDLKKTREEINILSSKEFFKI